MEGDVRDVRAEIGARRLPRRAAAPARVISLGDAGVRGPGRHAAGHRLLEVQAPQEGAAAERAVTRDEITRTAVVRIRRTKRRASSLVICSRALGNSKIGCLSMMRNNLISKSEVKKRLCTPSKV